ncbi:MAG: heme ABC transporter ATP-binding protein [Alphaproteobacteria bacterium]|nr:heme ABC transporter ATP-binding protein [Alphaproteobacteria bacterium]
MLAARDIHVERAGRQILRAASLAIEPGAITAVLGPNGAGKSTLLSVLSGAMPADSGRVELDGLPLRDWPRQALATRRAVLSQTTQLNFPFTVRQVVALGRAPHAAEGDPDRDRHAIDAALAQTDITALAQRTYTTLSGGERQRTHLARVMAQIWRDAPTDGAGAGTLEEPAYLLLDEPSNNLDLLHQHQIMSHARDLADRQVGVLAILHDPGLAAAYADRVVVLKEGRIVADGAPESVLTPALFLSAFGMPVTVVGHPETGRPVILSP